MALAEAVLATLILIATFGLLIARQVRGAITGYAAQSILLGGLAIAMFAGSRLPHLLALGLLTIGINTWSDAVARVAIGIDREAETATLLEIPAVAGEL